MYKKLFYLLMLLIVLIIGSCSVENDDLVQPNSNSTPTNPIDSTAQAD